MLCIPEAFAFIGTHYTQTIAQAEKLDGPRFTAYRMLAKKFGLWLSLGGYQEAGGPDNRVYNTHVIVDE